MLYICPFSESQRTKYIDKFISTAKSLQENYFEISFYPNIQEYITQFQKFSALSNVAKNPYMLRILMSIFKDLSENFKQKF